MQDISQDQEPLLLGSISDHGICATEIQRVRGTFRSICEQLRIKTYHIGICGKISGNTLPHSNPTRDWRIYADFACTFIRKAKQLYANDVFDIEFEQTIYDLDATTIDLCPSLFPRATFRKTRAP